MADNPEDRTQIGGGQDIGDPGKANIGGGQDVGGTSTPPADTAGLDPKLQAFMTSKGLKTVDEVIDFANKAEKKITDLSTRSKLTDYGLPPMPNFPRREPPKVDLEIPEDITNLIDDRDKFKRYSEQLVEKASKHARDEFQREQDEKEAYKIYREAEYLIRQDPEKFEKLRPTMKALYERYPHATPTELYQEADRVFEHNRRAALDEIKKDLGLDGVNLADIKNLASRANAPLSDTAGSTGGGGLPTTLKPASQMTPQERKDVVMDAIFSNEQSVLRDDEP